MGSSRRPWYRVSVYLILIEYVLNPFNRLNGSVKIVRLRFCKDGEREDPYLAMKTLKTHLPYISQDLKLTEITNEIYLLRNRHPNIAELKAIRYFDDKVFLFTPVMKCSLTDLRERKVIGLEEPIVIYIVLEVNVYIMIKILKVYLFFIYL